MADVGEIERKTQQRVVQLFPVSSLIIRGLCIDGIEHAAEERRATNTAAAETPSTPAT